MVCCLSLQPLVQEQSIDTSFQEDYPNPSLFHNEIVILQLNKQKRQIRNLPILIFLPNILLIFQKFRTSLP